jgi:membrane protein
MRTGAERVTGGPAKPEQAREGLWTVLVVGALALLSYQVGREDRAGGEARSRDPSPSPLTARPGAVREAVTDHPTSFRGAAWRAILMRTIRESADDGITTVAGGIAFYSLLALFPAIAALVSLYALVADPSTIRGHLAQLSFLLPPNSFSIVEDQVQRVVSQGGTELGVKFLFGLGFSLWSATAAVKAMIEGLNVAYEEKETRSFLMFNAVSLLLTFGALVSLLVIIGLAAVMPALFAAGASEAARFGAGLVRWPAMLILLSLGLSVLYRFGPSRKRPKWRWVTWGGCVAAVAVVLVSVLFGWYLANFANYDQTYGSLGAVMGLLMWMWLSACAVLFGAELNSEMERQSAVS